MQLRPIGPDIPTWLSPTLQSLTDAVQELLNPTQPRKLLDIANADLPPAEDWPGCAVHVTDKNCIAVSTDVAGTYTWLRADGSAI